MILLNSKGKPVSLEAGILSILQAYTLKGKFHVPLNTILQSTSISNEIVEKCLKKLVKAKKIEDHSGSYSFPRETIRYMENIKLMNS